MDYSKLAEECQELDKLTDHEIETLIAEKIMGWKTTCEFYYWEGGFTGKEQILPRNQCIFSKSLDACVKAELVVMSMTQCVKSIYVELVGMLTGAYPTSRVSWPEVLKIMNAEPRIRCVAMIKATEATLTSGHKLYSESSNV